MIIRRFDPADAQPCRDVFYAAVRIGAAGHYTQAELIDWVAEDVMSEGWGDWLGRHFTVVAEDAGRVVGFFMLEADGYLNMAFVHPEFHRRGVGRALYDAVLAEARARHMPVLTVWASRLFAPFLRRAGWQADADPPPRGEHPIAGDGPEPIEYALKLVLV